MRALLIFLSVFMWSVIQAEECEKSLQLNEMDILRAIQTHFGTNRYPLKVERQRRTQLSLPDEIQITIWDSAKVEVTIKLFNNGALWAEVLGRNGGSGLGGISRERISYGQFSFIFRLPAHLFTKEIVPEYNIVFVQIDYGVGDKNDIRMWINGEKLENGSRKDELLATLIFTDPRKFSQNVVNFFLNKTSNVLVTEI